MSSCIEQLQNDHRSMVVLLEILEGKLAELRSTGDTNELLVFEIMHYIANYTDLYHHPREDLIFKRLLAADPDPILASRINDLLQEHEVLAVTRDEFLGALSDCLDSKLPQWIVRLLGGAERSKGEMRVLDEYAEKYLAQLRAHMRSEEREVFPAALEALGAEDWDVITAEWGKEEDPLLGHSVQRQYEDLKRAIIDATRD
jgi:hemerythrin-like domain-containing protein